MKKYDENNQYQLIINLLNRFNYIKNKFKYSYKLKQYI